MSTPTRLLLFSLISAIENDLRDLVRIHLLAQSGSLLLPRDLKARALERFHRDRDDSSETPGDDTLLSYFDLGDTFKLLNQFDSLLPEGEKRYLRSVTSLLEELVPIRNRVMHGRPLLGMDYEVVLGTTQRLLADRPSMWQELAVTLDRANHNPEFVFSARIPEYWSERSRTHHNLPSLDCDDTGFVGRSTETAAIQKAIRGPYPVITILGEGGVGKTATALKAVWDLQAEGVFDAIVWASAKTSVLSGTELKRVEGAISTTLGLLTAVSQELSGQTANPLEEILEYLSDFKVLLLLDNLETVAGAELRDFLERLPSGSKVLVTSRIGLGALDYPIRLSGMSDSDAVLLMRIVARLRGVGYLVETDNKTLEEYCRQLHRNPGFIKWFVSGVQTGSRPEELLAKPDGFLDFCLNNVYEFLHDHSRRLVNAMACVSQPVSQGEAAFLTSLPEKHVHAGLLQLISTGMVSMLSAPTGNTFTTTYRISDLARRYILTKRAPSDAEQREYARKVTQLRFTDEHLSQLRNANPYHMQSIHTRSKRDLPIARMLLDALELSRRGQIAAAIATATEAKDLDPGFAESRRVLGFIHNAAGNIAAARDEYESAVDLDPTAARTRLFYGGFLHRDDDLDGAIFQLREAEKLDPTSSAIKLEVARCLLYRHELDSAVAKLAEVEPKSLEVLLRKYHDLRLQCHVRRSEDALNRGDVSEAIEALETAKNYFDGLDDDIKDLLILRRMDKAASTAFSCVARAAHSHGAGSPLHSRAVQVEQRFAVFSARVANRRPATVTDPDQPKSSGIVASLFRTYGFIASGEEQFFFHKGSLEAPNEWAFIKEGSSVAFNVGTNHKGRCAVSVVLRSAVQPEA